MVDTMSPLAAIHQYLDAFNQGDVKAIAAMCYVPMSILDGLPPHAWQGPTASEDRYRDVMAARRAEWAPPWHVMIRGAPLSG